MASFPQSNLPPKSQPWGRQVEKAVTTNISNARSAGIATNNNLKQINSSINLLQRQQNTLQQNQETLIEQQDFLSGLQTYASSSAVQYSDYTVNQWISFPPLSLTFTIDRNYSVIVSAFGETKSASYGIYTIPTAGVEWKCSISLNGSTYDSTVGSILSIYPHTSAYQVLSDVTEPSTNSRIFSLTPGTYTFTATWSAYNYGDAGQLGSVRIYDRNMTAVVAG